MLDIEEPKKELYQVYIVRKDTGAVVKQATCLGYSIQEVLQTLAIKTQLDTAKINLDNLELYYKVVGHAMPINTIKKILG